MLQIFKGRKPDVTPAQIIGLLLAGLPALASVLHAFNVYTITPEQTDALENALQWCAIAAGALFVSDAGLRASRGKAEAITQAASFTAPRYLEPQYISGSVGSFAPEPIVSTEPQPSDEEEAASPPPDPEATARAEMRRGVS